MSPLLLDTHALVWLLEGSRRLGREARRMADVAAREESLLVSAITFWEVAMMTQRRRLELSQPVTEWRRKALGLGITEVPVTGDIGILATELDGLPADAADRIIAASARAREATLLTADANILRWKGELERHDARR